MSLSGPGEDRAVRSMLAFLGATAPSWVTMSVSDSERGRMGCESRDHPLSVVRGWAFGRALPLNPHRLRACLILAERWKVLRCGYDSV